MASATLSPTPPAASPTPTPKELSPRLLTFGEYMELERKSDVKHHFYFGELIDVAGASYDHNMVSSNLFLVLANALKGSGCRTFGSDLKVFISEKVGYYPDIVVHCGNPLITYGEVLQNPVLIAEVLSSSTEAFDRGRKFQQYRTIASLRHLLFLEQNHCLVEHYERSEAGFWFLRAQYEQLDQTIALIVGEASVALPMSDIYQFVEFPEGETEPDAAVKSGQSEE